MQSPAMWDYALRALDHRQRCALAVVHHVDGSLAGVVPVRTSRYTLRYRLGTRTLWNTQFRVVQILGSQPLLRDEERLYVALVRDLFLAFPHCDAIEMQSVLMGSYCGRIIRDSRDLRQSAMVFLPEETTDLHLISLPGSFEAYLAKFKSKTRYNLRREVRRLRERGMGRLDLVRVEREADVKAFLEVAGRLSRISWQYRASGWAIDDTPVERLRFSQLANAGVLRSYFLRCGGEVCAYVRGFQYNDIFYYSKIGFDERFADFSPGTVLLYLLIEDLFRHRPPRLVNLYSGSSAYKELFATEHLPETAALLVRRDLANYLRTASYAAFRFSVRAVKRLLHWRRS